MPTHSPSRRVNFKFLIDTTQRGPLANIDCLSTSCRVLRFSNLVRFSSPLINQAKQHHTTARQSCLVQVAANGRGGVLGVE